MVQMELKAIQMGRLLPGIYYLFLQIEIFCWYDFNTGLKKMLFIILGFPL